MRSQTDNGQRTILKAMIARVNKDPEIQKSLTRQVKVGTKEIEAELDSGAQVSIVGKELVNALGLELRRLDKEWLIEGINSSEKKLRSNYCVNITIDVSGTRANVSCFVVDTDKIKDLLLLGLDFIFDNMDIAIDWIREAELAARYHKVQEDRDNINQRDDIPAVTASKLESTPVIDFQEHAEELVHNYIDGNGSLINEMTFLEDEIKFDEDEYSKASIMKVNATGSNTIPLGKTSSTDKMPPKITIRKVRAKLMNKTLRSVKDLEYSSILLIRKVKASKDPKVVANDSAEATQIKKEFPDVIRRELSNEIEYTGRIQHSIDVINDSKPTYNRPYRLTMEEKQELERQIDELVTSGRLYPTTSPYGAPVLFAKKKDGSMRLCCDFRRLNAVTIKSRFPLPLIEDLFDHLQGAKWFTSLDLISGYHQIPVREEDQPKTAIVTPNGQYAWRVMPFGLTNAPSTFQMVMNDLFRPLLHKSVVIYLDDILIYSKTKEQHLNDVRKALELLRSVKLIVKESKTMLFQQSIYWLGHFYDSDGLHMDPDKLKAIQQWPTPKTPKEARSWLGLAGFYRRFIKDFSDIARPIFEFITGKQRWGFFQQIAFQKLKSAMTSAPVLRPFSNDFTVRVTTDASNFAIGAVLELIDDNGRSVGVVGYLSRILVHYQLNWPVRDKEFYAIVSALKHWRHYLLGKNFELHTDHKSLETIMKSTDLNARLQRWVSQLVDYDFTIKYIPGETNKADGLSRISIKQISISTGRMESFLTNKIKQSYSEDSFLQRVISVLKGKEECPLDLRTLIKRYSFEDGLLYYGILEHRKDRLVIPTKELQYEIMRTYHTSKAAGHPGVSRTYAKISAFYYWNKMKDMITKFCRSCIPCQKSKNSHLLPVGVYHPLAIPNRRFEAINIDFVSGMNLDEGCDQVMVITDRLTKWAIMKAMNKHTSSQEIAEILVQEVVFQYGIPRYIVSDRDPKFVNAMWEEFSKRLEITTGFSTAYNPQSDGQVERLNKTMVEILRTFTKGRPNWVKYLPAAAFAYNTTHQISLGASPFVALRGYTERFSGLYNTKWDKPKFTIPKGSLTRENAMKAMKDYLQGMEDRLVMIQDGIAKAQETQSRYYNSKHRAPETFKPGDKILIKKDAYLNSPAGRKFHYMWFGPFEVARMIGDQDVEIKRGELGSRKHNVFNLRSVKRYVSTDTQFHAVPNLTLKQLRKNPDKIVRIIDSVKNEQGEEVLSLFIDGCTEADPVKVPITELSKFLSKFDLNRLYNKFKKNRPWIRNNVELVS